MSKTRFGVAAKRCRLHSVIVGVCQSAVAACGFSYSIAYAQTAMTTAPQETQGLEEIVVTAQRRSENLQHAAIAVTALTADVLAERNVTAANDLTKLVPSVNFSTGGGSTTQVSLRGVGALTGNALAEQVIPFNLDGVYLARSGASGGQFYDLERIEVLKGPQGTLYGRNATAGAVNLISAKPQHDFGGYVSLNGGNYGHREGEGALNLPLSDKVFLRVAGQSVYHDGYYSDGYDDQKQYSGRASLLVEVNDGLNILLSGDYAHFNNRGGEQVFTPFLDPAHPYLGITSPPSLNLYRTTPIGGAGSPPGTPPVSVFESLPATDGFNDTTFSGTAATVNWNTGLGTLTALGSFRDSRTHYKSYSPGFRLDEEEKSKTGSFETRFATPDENRLKGVVGAYYFHDTGSTDDDVFIADLIPFTRISIPDPTRINDFTTRAAALFGQARLDLTSAIRLIGGARYSNEKKSIDGTIHLAQAPVTGNLTFNNTTWKVGVEADVAPQSLAYFTVETGFKAGGFYGSEAPNSFKPEFLTAWTLGSKNRFFQNRVQLNAEAFYWNYKDKQVTHLAQVTDAFGTSTPLITENAGRATLYGLELETRVLVTPGDDIFANILYEHTKYNSYVVNNVFNNGAPPATNCAFSPDLPPGSGKFTVNCSGNGVAQAPQWSAALGYTRTFLLPSSGRIVFATQATVKSSYWLGEEHLVGQRQGGYATGDVSLTYNSRSERWSVGTYVDNVADRAVALASFVQPLFARPVVTLQAPRTYGVRLRYKF